MNETHPQAMGPVEGQVTLTDVYKTKQKLNAKN